MRRHPLLTILMAVTGVILLLPGVCAAAFMLGGISNAEPSIVGLWLFCFLIAAGGVVLLYKAFQKPSDPDHRPTLS
jgi:hypothetical protein